MSSPVSGLPSSLQQVNIARVREQSFDHVFDQLAVEEPLEIRLSFGLQSARLEKTISLTMRTPGEDAELAVGFLIGEGIVAKRDWLQSVESNPFNPNSVKVILHPDAPVDLKRLERNFYTTSSCGVCGKTSIEALKVQGGLLVSSAECQVERDVIVKLPDLARTAQKLFSSTGGIHASSLFNLSGELELVHEDVGRHNALDKVIGAKFLAGAWPLNETILLVSGRASFELVQKAAVSGIRVFCAVGAPSSLAVELAKEVDMTLVGFLRERRFNIYHGEKRILG